MIGSDAFLPMDVLSSIDNESFNDQVVKHGSYAIVEFLDENLSELSDEVLLQQINFITEVFEQNQDTIQLDTSRNIRILPALVEQVQKNRSVEVIAHVMCVNME